MYIYEEMGKPDKTGTYVNTHVYTHIFAYIINYPCILIYILIYIYRRKLASLTKNLCQYTRAYTHICKYSDLSIHIDLYTIHIYRRKAISPTKQENMSTHTRIHTHLCIFGIIHTYVYMYLHLYVKVNKPDKTGPYFNTHVYTHISVYILIHPYILIYLPIYIYRRKWASPTQQEPMSTHPTMKLVKVRHTTGIKLPFQRLIKISGFTIHRYQIW